MANRLLIGGTGSGCGKTIVTSALLRLFQRKKGTLCAFKCGPDYIDPMFHRAALGIPSYNLDLFFLSETQVCEQIVLRCPEKMLGIIEGVMGFYDGISGTTIQASTAHLGIVTQTPAILVVRPKGKSLSLAAEIQGFLKFSQNTIAGVILNGVSKAMYPFYRTIVERTGVRVYGHLPELPQAEIPSRHLGLVTAEEIIALQEKLDLLADCAEETLDWKGLLELAEQAPDLQVAIQPVKVVENVRIAIAQDAAFCFYYADNLELLEKMGVEWIPFSPLTAETLPEPIDGLYLGGGYPELYGKALAQNANLRLEIVRKIEQGLPTIAECGGFLYLQEWLTTKEGHYPMVGVCDGEAEITQKLQKFGYITLTAQRDNLLCKAGERIRAHEFHYAKATQNGALFLAQKPNGAQWMCVQGNETLYAGFPHLYLRANPIFAVNFIQCCAKRRRI